MLAIPFEERRFKQAKFGWIWPVIVQPKLDGERCRAVWNGDSFDLFSSQNNLIVSVPHINEELMKIKNINENIRELDGELYLHKMNFNDIHSIVSRRKELHQDYLKMEYHIFDIVNSKTQVNRLIEMENFAIFNSIVKKVSFQLAYSIDQIMDLYLTLLDNKYEGIIIRHPLALYVRKRSVFMMKFKERKSDYYKIIGIRQAVSEKGEKKPLIGSFICEKNDCIFPVGAGKINHKQRAYIWKNKQEFIGKICHVSYQSIFPNTEKPRFGLCIEVVEENPEEVKEDYSNFIDLCSFGE